MSRLNLKKHAPSSVSDNTKNLNFHLTMHIINSFNQVYTT